MEWIGFLVCCLFAGMLNLSGVAMIWATVKGLTQQSSDAWAGVFMLLVGAAVTWACWKMAPFEVVLK